MVGNSVLINWSNYGGLSGLGFPELWKAFYEEEIGSYDKLLMMSFMLASTGAPKDDDDYDEEDEEDRAAERSGGQRRGVVASVTADHDVVGDLYEDLPQLGHHDGQGQFQIGFVLLFVG